MKGFVISSGILAVIAVIFIGGILYFGGQGLIGQASLVTLSDGTTCTVKEGTKLTPLFGWYECKVVSKQTKYHIVDNVPDVYWWLSTNTITCGKEGFTDQCDYQVTNPKKEKWFIFDKKLRLKWTIGEGWHYVGTDTGLSTLPDNLPIAEFTISNGRTVGFAIEEFNIWSQTWQLVPNAQIEVREQYDQFGLVQYPMGTRDETGCLVNNNNDGIGVIIGGDTVGLSSSVITGKVGQLQPYGKTAYVRDWAFSPSDYGLYDRNGKKVYCAGSSLYEVDYVKLTTGCYGYPSSILSDKIECCPGAIAGSAICGTDFKWHTQEDPNTGLTCISDLQCGGGFWQPNSEDPSLKSVIRRKCVDGQCTFEKKTTGCSTSQACPASQVCDLNTYTGIGECVSSESSAVVFDPRDEGMDSLTGELTEWPGNILIKYMTMWIVAFMVLLILTGIAWFITPTRLIMQGIMARTGGIKGFVIIIALLAGLLVVFFTIPVASLTAMVVS